MTKKIKYLTFDKKDRDRFLIEYTKLSTRAKMVLRNQDMLSYDTFYSHLFINRDTRDFELIRNCGTKTTLELVTFMRTMFNSDGRYNKELSEFENGLLKLTPRAKGILKSYGISLFETFYYTYVIKKEVIEYKERRNCPLEVKVEVEKFVKSYCGYLGVKVPGDINIAYFDPKNPEIPFIPDRKTKKVFKTEFNNLSDTTRHKLSKMGADSFEGFYLGIIAKNSPFNKVLNKFGELTLIEILRFRSILTDTFNEIRKP
jgi:hypothetical protein